MKYCHQAKAFELSYRQCKCLYPNFDRTNWWNTRNLITIKLILDFKAKKCEFIINNRFKGKFDNFDFNKEWVPAISCRNSQIFRCIHWSVDYKDIPKL